MAPSETHMALGEIDNSRMSRMKRVRLIFFLAKNYVLHIKGNKEELDAFLYYMHSNVHMHTLLSHFIVVYMERRFKLPSMVIKKVFLT